MCCNFAIHSHFKVWQWLMLNKVVKAKSCKTKFILDKGVDDNVRINNKSIYSALVVEKIQAQSVLLQVTYA